MAVYGNMLAFFPEQFRMFDYFLMSPNVGASYTERTEPVKVKGVFQYMKKGDLTRENDTEANVNIPTFWTRTKLNVGKGFIQKEDELYRIKTDYEWFFEGGFYCYGLELFVGNSDMQQPFEYVELGQNQYD